MPLGRKRLRNPACCEKGITSILTQVDRSDFGNEGEFLDPLFGGTSVERGFGRAPFLIHQPSANDPVDLFAIGYSSRHAK